MSQQGPPKMPETNAQMRAMARARRPRTITTTIAEQAVSITTTGLCAPPVVPVADPPLTKEQAMADTLRALKECFPDRWERVWDALGKESASDKAVAEIGKMVAGDPRGATGAAIGATLGAALARMLR